MKKQKCELPIMATTIIRDVPAQEPEQSQNEKKPRRTFMLHSPDDMTALGRFISTDWRYAALKAASRGHTKILLRQTGTREVREFDGNRLEIEPKEINRGGRIIKYTHRPQVKYNRKFVYSGAVDENSSVPTNPVPENLHA